MPALQLSLGGLIRRVSAIAAIGVAVLLAAALAPAQGLAATGAKNFDHLSTGFPLTGQHQSARCEDCHVHGIFKGTPAQCAACHTPGTLVTAVMIPNTHFPVSQPCDTCHTTNSFYGAYYAHTDTLPGTCATCHNNVFAQGKTPNHIQTSASCDACHSTISFAGAYTTLPVGHIPTTQVCSTCHSGGFNTQGTVMNHAGTEGVCDTCHAPGKTPFTFTIPGTLTQSGYPVPITPMSQGGIPSLTRVTALNHIPAAASCDQCHTNGVFTKGSGFRNGVMHHAAVSGASCAACHDSATVFAGTSVGTGGEPFQIPGTAGTPGAGNHIPLNGLDCGNSGCHAVSDTPTATGTGFATNVAPALSAAGHKAVNLFCETCHAEGMTWKLNTETMVTPGTAHIPPDNAPTASVACSGCHAASNFTVGGFKITTAPVMSVAAHSAVASAVPACTSCHEASAPDLTFQGVLTNIYLRPDTATSGLSKGLGLDTYHGTGNAATQDCSGCHSTTPPFSNVALPSDHIALKTPTPACSDCHANGYSPGITTMKHADVTGTCTSCHSTSTVFAGTGQGTDGQPWQMSGTVGLAGTSTTHFPVNGKDCSSSGCHAVSDTMTSNGAQFVINATPALSAAGHTTVNLSCQSCHAVGMTWKGIATMVTPAAAHIPPDNLSSGAVACSGCHSATSFGSGGFHITTSPVMSVAAHAAVASAVPACDTCHEANAADLTFQGVLTNIYLRPDTANSGLSLGLGADPTHGTGNQATEDCGQCHSTTPPFTSNLALPSNHIPLNTPTPACADCHSAGYAPGLTVMKHADVTTKTPACATCHDTSTVFAGTGQGTNGQPWQIPGTVGTPGAGNHIPIGGVGCNGSGCHALSGASDTMTSNGAGFVLSGTPVLSAAGHTTLSAISCQSCHTIGDTWKLPTGVSMVTPASTHIPPDNLSSGTVACSGCHSATSFGTGGFHITTTPVMSVAAHTAVASAVPACDTCHEANAADLTFQGVLTSIYLRPDTANSGLSLGLGLDPTHGTGNQATQDCKQCHSTTPPFTSNLALPSNHIPLNSPTPACTDCHASGYAPGVSTMKHADVTTATPACATCHYTSTVFAGSGQGSNGQPWQVPGTVGTPGAGNHIPIGSAGCNGSGCHSVSDTMTSTGAQFVLSGTPVLSAAGHTTLSALSCQSCHTIGDTWKLPTGVSIVTPASAHIPPDNLSSGAVACSGCHSATSFGTGGFHITTSPVMSVAAHTAVASAVPACDTCHEANTGDLGFQGVLTSIYLRPDTANSGLSLGLGLDPSHGTGNAATQDCANCHSTTPPFSSVTMPSNHIPLNTPTPACADCHAAGYSPGTSTMKHADVTTKTPACATCHYTSTVFAGSGQGTNGQPWQISGTVGTPGSGNHIPIASAGCNGSGCHAVSDTMTSTGAQFVLSATPALSSAGHTTLSSLSCQTCHAATYTWKLPTGVTMVTPASTHVPPDNTAPASMACSSCHSASNFSTGGFHLSGTAGTSAPVMTVAMHTAVASYVSACDTCHEANAGDLTFQGITTQIYLRPDKGANSGLSNGADTAHGAGNAATADCSGCHSTTPPFQGGTLPSNHIPLNSPTPACADCHANGYAPGVSTMKHSDVTTATPACATCHYTSTVYAGTGQGTNGQPWQIPGTVGTAGSGNHIPVASAGCNGSGCHSINDTMTSTGAGFVLSSSPVLSSTGHTTLSSLTCATCHSAGYTWKLPSGVSMVGASTAHIPPDNAAPGAMSCTSCHSSTIAVGGFHLSGTAGTTSPVMTVAMHTAVASYVSACETCHENSAGNLTYQGVLTQIYLRPPISGSADSLSPVDANHPTTGDCANCHTTTPPFSASTSKPTGHILVSSSAACTSCHTTGAFNTVVLPMPHTYVQGTCGSCHGQGLSPSVYVGPFAGPSTLGGTYTAGEIAFNPKQIVSSPAIGASGGHIPPPSADDCNVCHTSTSAFGPGTAMVHTNITSGCATCHSNGAIWYGVSSTATQLVTTGGKVLSPLHVPTTGANNPACEECHSTTVFTSFSGTKVNHTSGAFMKYTQGSSGSSTPTCKSCHGPSGATWYGVSLSTATVGSHHGSTTSQDCINCHNTSQFDSAAAAAVARRVERSTGGLGVRPRIPGLPGAGTGSTTGSTTGTTSPFTHVGVVPGDCTSCHSLAGGAPTKPASHLPTTLSCDSCHRTSSWLPAIFTHTAVAASGCASCHSGNWATAKPATHMLTTRSCDTCHRSTSSWTPVAYSHFDTVYTPHPASVRCVDCHTTNTEQIVYKFPSLKSGCGGCHGPHFETGTVRRSKGPATNGSRG